MSNYELNSGKNLKYFIQVNIGNELQKSGIPVSEIENFYNYCINEKKLDIQGLMVIPPNDNNTKKYFKTMNELNISLGLKELSMGMSSDYEEAVENNSTFVRIGSSIFGKGLNNIYFESLFKYLISLFNSNFIAIHPLVGRNFF